MSQKPYSDKGYGETSLPRDLFAITPQDDVELAVHARAISVATEGPVMVTMEGGGKADFYAVPGVQMTGHFIMVHATGTDATGIRGWA